MPLALLDLYLALEFKGFSDWAPRTKAIVGIVGGVLLLVGTIALIRKIGFVAIAVPSVIIGILYVMNQNSGCLEKATEVNETGTYDKGKMKKPVVTPPAGNPAPAAPAR